MLQTLHKRVGHAVLHELAVIVIRLMVHIHDRLLHLSDAMPQEIDGNHGYGILPVIFLQHILLVVILQGEVTAEAKCLGGQPSLLQLDEHQVRLVVLVEHCGGKVDAEHRDRLTPGDVRILIAPDFNVDDFLLQQCRQDGLGYAVIFHQIFEYRII